MPRICRSSCCIGVALFLVITFWPLHRALPQAPGCGRLVVGFLITLIALVLMNWYDPVGKFGAAVATRSSSTNGLGVAAVGVLRLAGLDLLARRAWSLGGRRRRHCAAASLGYAVAVLGAAVGRHLPSSRTMQLVDFAGGIDHSLGVYVDLRRLPRLRRRRPRRRADASRGRRPARVRRRACIDLAARACRSSCVGCVLGCCRVHERVLVLAAAAQRRLHRPARRRSPARGLASLAWPTSAGWAGRCSSSTARARARRDLPAQPAARLRRGRARSASASIADLLSDARHLATSRPQAAPQYGALWQNLGAGGWVACIAFALLDRRRRWRCQPPHGAADRALQETRPIDALPVTTRRPRRPDARPPRSRVIPVALVDRAVLPADADRSTGRTSLVTQIGVYVLLAVGLNVVVGWAGLLDLGYIAFYGIGSYTTAYFTGSLPLKPPSLAAHARRCWRSRSRSSPA